MNTDSITRDTIVKYVPNVFAEVEGETPLIDKLAPFIASARLRLERDILGPDDFLSPAHNELALKVVVADAFADAVPSLDIVVTPSGLGVINTDNLAPASKERVERLIASLRTYVEANRKLLIDICRLYPEWRASERGRYFCASFICSPKYYEDMPEFEHMTFDAARRRAIIAEGKLASTYLGRHMPDKLRADFCDGTVGEDHPLVAAVRDAVLALMSPAASGRFDQNRLWHAAEPVLYELSYYPDYFKLWQEEVGNRFGDSGFKNDIKGGFYF